MNIRFSMLVCVSFIFFTGGCAESSANSNDGSKNKNESKEESSEEGVKENDNKLADTPNMDDCIEVYGKEECEQITEYYKSEEGQKELDASETDKYSAKSQTSTTHKDIYEKVSWLVKEMFGVPERTIPADYEKSLVEKRDDGLYYIQSSYEIKGTGNQADTYYEFEMLMDNKYNLIDAYFPGSTGRYSRPMVYDKLKNMEIPEVKKVSPEEEIREEKKREETMKSIYGEEHIKDNK